jgi:hypothetical protein
MFFAANRRRTQARGVAPDERTYWNFRPPPQPQAGVRPRRPHFLRVALAVSFALTVVSMFTLFDTMIFGEAGLGVTSAGGPIHGGSGFAGLLPTDKRDVVLVALTHLRAQLPLGSQVATVPIAGLPRFPRLFARDALLSALIMNDLSLLMEVLPPLAALQGVRANASTGEEPGKVRVTAAARVSRVRRRASSTWTSLQRLGVLPCVRVSARSCTSSPACCVGMACSRRMQRWTRRRCSSSQRTKPGLCLSGTTPCWSRCCRR